MRSLVERALIAGALLLLSSSCAREEPQPSSAPAASPIWLCEFVDVTREAGISFVHANGSTGSKYLPETMGSGAVFFDYDGDGNIDIFFVQSGVWTAGAAAAPNVPRCELYRGLGDGRFADVTERSGAGLRLFGMGASAADADGDGDQDLFVTAWNGNVFLRNDDSRFVDATRQAGLESRTWIDSAGDVRPEWSTASAFFDADRDGDLDLFVANYVAWSSHDDIPVTLDGRNRIFTTPDRYVGQPCRLFRNDGSGRFSDVSRDVGLLDHLAKALGVLIEDVNQDGLDDVLVANDTQRNFLFLARENGTFIEAGQEWNIAYDENGRARAGMGIDSTIIDDRPAIAIGNFAREPLSFFRHAGKSFDLETFAAGLGASTIPTLTFGLVFADLDLDGVDELVLANGHIEPEIGRFRSDEQAAQSAQIFKGRADGTFVDVTAKAGADFSVPRLARGLLTADVDGDGDLDLLLTVNGGAPVLLRNDRARDGRSHLLRIELAPAKGGAGAVGTRVVVDAGGRRQVRRCRTGSSYLSQSMTTTLVFGCGPAERAERVEIIWPRGERSILENVETGRSVRVEEPSR